jgi:hypothetical protein
VGPGAANKRHKLAIELTGDLLVVDLEARSTPAVSGEEAAAARPPLLQFRCARRQRPVACVSGGCASVSRGAKGGWPTPEASGGAARLWRRQWRARGEEGTVERVRARGAARNGFIASLLRVEAREGRRGGLAGASGRGRLNRRTARRGPTAGA